MTTTRKPPGEPSLHSRAALQPPKLIPKFPAITVYTPVLNDTVFTLDTLLLKLV